MVEWAILLHQNYNVLNIVNRPCAIVCRNVERLGNARIHGGYRTCRRYAHQLQECAPIVITHGERLSSKDREFRKLICCAQLLFATRQLLFLEERSLAQENEHRITAI